jgi:hypothetical protein
VFKIRKKEFSEELIPSRFALVQIQLLLLEMIYLWFMRRSEIGFQNKRKFGLKSDKGIDLKQFLQIHNFDTNFY